MVARLLIARVAGGNAKFFRESWYRKAQVCYTTKTKERGAGVIARDAVAAGVEVVLVVVGDGTVSEVARELVHKPGNAGHLTDWHFKQHRPQHRRAGGSACCHEHHCHRS